MRALCCAGVMAFRLVLFCLLCSLAFCGVVSCLGIWCGAVLSFAALFLLCSAVLAALPPPSRCSARCCALPCGVVCGAPCCVGRVVLAYDLFRRCVWCSFLGPCVVPCCSLRRCAMPCYAVCVELCCVVPGGGVLCSAALQTSVIIALVAVGGGPRGPTVYNLDAKHMTARTRAGGCAWLWVRRRDDPGDGCQGIKQVKGGGGAVTLGHWAKGALVFASPKSVSRIPTREMALSGACCVQGHAGGTPASTVPHSPRKHALRMANQGVCCSGGWGRRSESAVQPMSSAMWCVTNFLGRGQF